MQNTMLDSTISSNSQALSNASSAIKLFENPLFKVRVIMRCADPWFVAKDACDCLEIADASQACKNLDDDEKQVVARSPELSLLFTESSNAPTMTLIFGQKHNGIECALCPTAKRACDRAWVSAKNVEVWSKMSTTTLWRWLGKLEKARRIQSFSDMKKIKIDDENGRGHETTLYNLNVLNQLAMVCIDNEKLNEVSCKFSQHH